MPARRRCLSCGCASPSGTLRSMRRPRGSTPSPRACERPERRAWRIMKKPTLVNHPPTVELPPGNRALVAPIYQTVKFTFDTLEDTERYLRGERPGFFYTRASRSEEHTSELQSPCNLVCRLLLEKTNTPLVSDSVFCFAYHSTPVHTATGSCPLLSHTIPTTSRHPQHNDSHNIPPHFHTQIRSPA